MTVRYLQIIVAVTSVLCLFLMAMVLYPTADHDLEHQKHLGWSWKTVLSGVQSGSAPNNIEPIGFEKLVRFALPKEQRTNFAVNIGARDGKAHDPVYEMFANLQYKGLAFEGDIKVLPELQNNMKAVNHSLGVHIIPNYVATKTIVSVLQQNNVPKKLDVLKIDIDSIDLPVLRTILNGGYQPRFLMLEVNPDLPPPFEWYIEDTPEFHFGNYVQHGFYGVAPASVFNMAWQHGYRMLEIEMFNPNDACPFCEHNIWFAHEDVLRNLQNCSVDADIKYTEVLAGNFPGKKELYQAEWDDFVGLFWHRQAPGHSLSCLHVRASSCPKILMQTMLSMHGHKASVELLRPHRKDMAENILAIAQTNFKGLCPTCTFPGSIQSNVD